VLLTIRTKLIICITGVACIVGIFSIIVGSQLLFQTVLAEANTRIRFDLNAARQIYVSHITHLETAFKITSLDDSVLTSIAEKRSELLLNKLNELSHYTRVDFSGFVLPDKVLLCRLGPNAFSSKQEKVENPVVNYVLENRIAVAGTAIMDRSFLIAENPELAEKATIKLIPTPKAVPLSDKVETSSMSLVVGIPIYNTDARLIGVLYGGIILNRSTQIVDSIRDTVFKEEIYKSRIIGTATIFFKDIRISTNVMDDSGERAIGTRVSKEVNDFVLLHGGTWTKKAFVVNDWYITAYEPIVDIFDNRVGMLYVGVLESKYADLRLTLMTVFILITLSGIIVSILLGFYVSNRIFNPIKRLITASSEVLKGNFDPDIGPISASEIGQLQKTFRDMLESIKKRNDRQRLEIEYTLIQTEKQASIGRLAAGVAHEINNPLTGVLTFSHLLLKRNDLSEEVRHDLKMIAEQTERVRSIIKSLLNYSRQTEMTYEPVDINKIIEATIDLMHNQASIKGITINFIPFDNLPVCSADKSQLQSVIMNIILNALDATDTGGTVCITTGLGVSSKRSNEKGIEITISDNGCGIQEEYLDKLFDPFFTTKKVGYGTGLGLAVSYGIIENHEGSIQVMSTPGKGSTFIIWLPLKKRYANR
jgi:two-component system NtrC family sensor kinase